MEVNRMFCAKREGQKMNVPIVFRVEIHSQGNREESGGKGIELDGLSK
jgi:hypothetical protein